MKEIQILNNGDALYDIRRKINENFELVQTEAVKDPLASFGTNEGNETDGVADLLAVTDNTLSFKVGGEYPNLVMTSGDGVTTEIESVNDLHLQNLADGEYTVVVDGSNSNITDAEFYSQLLEPENPNDGDVWFNGENAVQSKYEMTATPTTAKTGADFTCMASMEQYRLAAGNSTVVVFSSDNGQTWTNVSLSSASTIYMVGCVVHDGAFRLISRDRYIYSVNKEGKISGGTQVTTDTSIQLTNLRHANNQYIVTCSNGSIFYSTDFQTWNIGTTGSEAQLLDIVFCNGNYYTINSNGEMFISTDLQSWTKQITNINYTTRLEAYEDKLLIGATTGTLYVYDTVTSNINVLDSVKTAQILDISVVNNNVLIVGRDGLCAITNDLKTLRPLTITEDNKNLTCIHENYILGQGGLMLQWTFYNEWVPYPYIPVGEVTISGGEVTYLTTYPYNSNGLHEASSSTFGLLRTAAVTDEMDCTCNDAVITPSNLYDLSNYRMANTSYEVEQKVGCPYHHNLQLKCTQAGTTSNEGLNTKGYLEPGTSIEDGTVIWQVEELGSGGGLEIGDIGIAPLGIDETKNKRRYLNGQLITQLQFASFTNKIKEAEKLYPSLTCTEEEWQTTGTMSVGGQVGKFVINDEDGTIRLPKIIMPIQGLTDLSKLGEIVEAGLPNITGSGYITAKEVASGVASGVTDYPVSSLTAGGGIWVQGLGANQSFNASLSNPIYGNSDTVQQEQIQYPYFIQVATGAETEDNIINEIELNNPFSLLDYKYSEYELNNISWLRSQGQYNSKAIYPAVYDLLLKIYNGAETKAGVSVKLSTETFTDYDFVLNTAEEAFRLPIKVKLASGKAVVGNGKQIYLRDNNNSAESFVWVADVDRYLGVNLTTGIENVGLSTDPTKSGIETSDSGLYLYFYVGETVQNANLINAGRALEILPNKLDKKQLYNKMTNCITEIPQDIKLELSNGVLTLKAGSKVYVPNGAGIFDEVVIENDMTYDTSETNLETGVFFVHYNGDTALGYALTSASASGTTAPAKTGLFYDTTSNVVKWNNNGSLVGGNGSFPIAIVTATNGVGVVSIDQVFNGFGYIGSTIFALPNVKGLIPNGKNEDGTLNNIEFTTKSVLISTLAGTYSNVGIWLSGQTIGLVRFGAKAGAGTWAYNEINNYNQSLNGNVQLTLAGLFNINSSVISSFQPKQPFRAVDYSDFVKEAISFPDYSTAVSVAVSLKTYTAPYRGWIIGYTSTNGATDSQMYVNGVVVGREYNDYVKIQMPLDAGDVLTWTGVGTGELNFLAMKGGN